MELSFRREAGALVAAVAGRLDTATAPELEAQCEPCLTAGDAWLALDLSEVTYISSRGVGSILRLWRKAQSLGGDLALCGARGLVAEVLGLFHLEQHLPVYDSVCAAVAGRCGHDAPAVEVSAPACLAEVPKLVCAAAEAGRAAGLPPETVMHLELAVEEAVVNICTHAYPGGEGVVAFRARPVEGGLQVEIVDWGEAFDPLSVPEPDLSRDLMARPVGGLGVFLIRRLTDEVRYQRRDGANVLTMVIRDRPALDE